MKRLISIILLFSFLCLSGCVDNQVQDTETVLTFFLNSNVQLQEAYDEVYGETAEDPAGESIRAVLEEQLGMYITEDFIDAYIPGNEISTMAIQAYLFNYTYKAESIDIEKAKTKGQYLYEAMLVFTDKVGQSTTVSVNGVVQYNDTGKIRTITLGGQELNEFYRNIAA